MIYSVAAVVIVIITLTIMSSGHKASLEECLIVPIKLMPFENLKLVFTLYLFPSFMDDYMFYFIIYYFPINIKGFLFFYWSHGPS